MKNPPHPGGVVLRQCIEPLGLSITDAAAALGVTRTTLSELVNGKRGISPEMAVRLSKVFGGSAESWLVQQAQYELAHVRTDELKLKKSLVHVVLTAGEDDTTAMQEIQQLEPYAQKFLDSWFEEEAKPVPLVLFALLNAWFERGRGRKVRFQIHPPFTQAGELKSIEVTNKEELDVVIGNGETLSTFLHGFDSVEPLSTKSRARR